MTCLHIIGLPTGKSIAMLLDQFEQKITVERVALGPALLESFAQVSQSGGINRVELQEFVGHQGMDERSAFLFYCHRHLLAGKGLPQPIRSGLPTGKSIAMLLDQFEQKITVERVALGPALLESFAQVSQSGGINRVELQEFVGHQGMDERSAFLFYCHRHLLAGKALPQPNSPLSQVLGSMGQLQVFHSLCTRWQKSDIVFLIGPVDRDQGGWRVWVIF